MLIKCNCLIAKCWEPFLRGFQWNYLISSQEVHCRKKERRNRKKRRGKNHALFLSAWNIDGGFYLVCSECYEWALSEAASVPGVTALTSKWFGLSLICFNKYHKSQWIILFYKIWYLWKVKWRAEPPENHKVNLTLFIFIKSEHYKTCFKCRCGKLSSTHDILSHLHRLKQGSPNFIMWGPHNCFSLLCGAGVGL